jgi:hypothetical protein
MLPLILVVEAEVLVAAVLMVLVVRVDQVS